MLGNKIRKKLFLSPKLKTFCSIDKIFTEKKLNEYKENGYTILPNVFSHDLIDELKAEVSEIIRKTDQNEFTSIFNATNDEKSRQRADKYFLESGDKIRFFLEKDALDEKGNLRYSREMSLNKIGHALHDLNKKFERFSYSKEIKYICKILGYQSPILAQSMYILKNARVGGEVSPHTDNTYLRTSPMSCTGIWVAFDDAKKDNGGMWGYPGSHRTKTNYFMKLIKDPSGINKTIYSSDELPKYPNEGEQPIEAEKGTVVLLHGDFVHFSYANKSEKQRHAYTLHVVESRNHKWEEDNWIQRNDYPFKFLNENKV